MESYGMRIAVVGSGGVGGYFGGRLAQAGYETHFIARGAHLAAIREKGLRVDSIVGDFVVEPASVTDDARSVGPVDVVIVATKTWQLPAAAESVRHLVDRETVVLPLLNGVQASEQLSAALGTGPVLGGLCRISSEIASPGHIRHTGMDPSILVGELDNRRTPRLEALVEALTDAGVDARIAEDIHVALWEKFIFIATWSGVGAITRAPLGVWRSLPETRAMAEDCLREAFAVGRARGVRLADECVAATMTAFDGLPPEGMASMQRDILAARPSELEAQNGAIVRLGTATGVPTPTHACIYSALLPQEKAVREE